MTKHLDLEAPPPDSAGHRSDQADLCVVEAVAYFAHEPFSDRPACVSPVIGAFLRSLDDRINGADRHLLTPIISLVVGTNTGRADDKIRAYLATDWAVRTLAPMWLERAGLVDGAAELRAIDTIDSADAARKAVVIIRGVRDATWAKCAATSKKLRLVADHAAYATVASALVAALAAYASVTAAAAATTATSYAARAARAASATAVSTTATAYAAHAAYGYAAYAASAADLPDLTWDQKKAYFRAKMIDVVPTETINASNASARELLGRMTTVGKRQPVTA